VSRDIKNSGRMWNISNVWVNSKYTHEIAPKIAIPKKASNEGKAIFTSKLDLNLRKNLVKCH
jgi:hypothetical protein